MSVSCHVCGISLRVYEAATVYFGAKRNAHPASQPAVSIPET